MQLPTDTNAGRSKAPVVMLLFFGLIVLTNAWVMDDAYIIARTADNLVNGYGLRWNVSERVQTFTCPLWTLLFTGGYALLPNAYAVAVGLNWLASVAAVAVVAFFRPVSWPVRVGAVLALTLSKAFVDYSTSGLESPLTHLLLAGVLALYLPDHEKTDRRLLAIGALCALLLTNRLDMALLVAPLVLHEWWSASNARCLGRRTGLMTLAGTPLVLWLAFATVYYGTPWPNTAYAKMPGSIPLPEMAQQGMNYFVDSFQHDPVTLITIALAFGAAAAKRSPRPLLVMVGVGLYLLYTLRIGGGFMSGRFFTAPLLASVFALMMLADGLTPRRWALAASGLVLIGLAAPRTPVLSTHLYGISYPVEYYHAHGIEDARAVYYPGTGLLRLWSNPRLPEHTWRREGERHRAAAKEVPVRVDGAMGMLGYYGGPQVHYIDRLGLTDPLLARLPVEPTDSGRIGHFRRSLPSGYMQTVRGGKNRLEDLALAKYYDRLCQLTRAPIWSAERWRVMWGMHTGGYDHLIDAYTRRWQRRRAQQGSETESFQFGH